MFRVSRLFRISAAAGGAGRGGRGTAEERQLHSWKSLRQNRRARVSDITELRTTTFMKPAQQARMLAEQARSAHQPVLEDLEHAEKFAAASVERSARPRSPTKSREQRRIAGNIKRGADVAHEMRSMSDAEWESVPMADKHHFVRYISEKLQSNPSEVTEMQRRRFYETTMFDPTREDPHRTVRDAYERVKLGLPTQFSLDRSLGVPDAVYEQADAALFDPADAGKIENAVTEVKQMFADYVKKKRLGVSTEAERRALALASQDLNLATQKHLAEMFKYAENRLQETMKEERERQLKAVAKVRAALERQKQNNNSNANDEAADSNTKNTKSKNKSNKITNNKERISRILRRNYGLDIETAESVVREMKLQEQFLRECEVLARMTTKRGFHHSPQDQSLDSYTEQLRDIYSMNPERMCRVDAVQYVAALEGLPPVDWAATWFARTLLLPLQSTPEFQALQRIREEEQRALQMEQELKQQEQEEQQQKQISDGTADKTTADKTTATNSNSNDALIPAPKPIAASEIEEKVIDLTTKMFVDPDDERLSTMHEKRLRYIAHAHMESQIKRMRENARAFDGAEDAPEADKVRELYSAIQEIREKALLERSLDRNDDETGNNDNNASSFNIFQHSPEALKLFHEMQQIVRSYISRRNVESKAEKKAKRLADLAGAIASANEKDVIAQVRRVREEKKREQMRRILDLVERDVRQELYWLETFAEADRPAPLPIPQPMSYVSAADVLHWREHDLADRNKDKGNPFKRPPGTMAEASFLGQPWPVPDKPLLFWGTGAKAVEQALQHAAEDAERRRRGEPLAPPYPCAENPWGWRLRYDPLDEPDDAATSDDVRLQLIGGGGADDDNGDGDHDDQPQYSAMSSSSRSA